MGYTISRDVLPSCRFLGTSSLAAKLSFSQSLGGIHGPRRLLLSGMLQGLSIDDLGGSCPHRLMLLAHPGAVGMIARVNVYFVCQVLLPFTCS